MNHKLKVEQKRQHVYLTIRVIEMGKKRIPWQA